MDVAAAFETLSDLDMPGAVAAFEAATPPGMTPIAHLFSLLDLCVRAYMAGRSPTQGAISFLQVWAPAGDEDPKFEAARQLVEDMVTGSLGDLPLEELVAREALDDIRQHLLSCAVLAARVLKMYVARGGPLTPDRAKEWASFVVALASNILPQRNTAARVSGYSKEVRFCAVFCRSYVAYQIIRQISQPDDPSIAIAGIQSALQQVSSQVSLQGGHTPVLFVLLTMLACARTPSEISPLAPALDNEASFDALSRQCIYVLSAYCNLMTWSRSRRLAEFMLVPSILPFVRLVADLWVRVRSDPEKLEAFLTACEQETLATNLLGFVVTRDRDSADRLQVAATVFELITTWVSGRYVRVDPALAKLAVTALTFYGIHLQQNTHSDEEYARAKEATQNALDSFTQALRWSELRAGFIEKSLTLERVRRLQGALAIHDDDDDDENDLDGHDDHDDHDDHHARLPHPSVRGGGSGIGGAAGSGGGAGAGEGRSSGGGEGGGVGSASDEPFRPIFLPSLRRTPGPNGPSIGHLMARAGMVPDGRGGFAFIEPLRRMPASRTSIHDSSDDDDEHGE